MPVIPKNLRLGSEGSNEMQENSTASFKYQQNFHKKNHSLATQSYRVGKNLNQRMETGDHSAKVSTNISQAITFHHDDSV
jgi:hypothetical protein